MILQFRQPLKKVFKTFCRTALLGGVFFGLGCESSITPLTCTLFDPGNIGGFGEKCPCLTSAQRAEIPVSWYIFSSRFLKPVHGRSRCVTGLREGGEEALDGTRQGYPFCFVGKTGNPPGIAIESKDSPVVCREMP